jgi:7-carboxy-7-deazaguanine synthase
MQQAWISEIFSSIQGEGPRVGERHVFVRFQGCDVGCKYCDTPASVPGSAEPHFRAQTAFDNSDEKETIENPVSSASLANACSRLRVPGAAYSVLSVTGGEPLLQHAFLAEWLPLVRKHFRIYLETSGIHHAELASLCGLIDYVSMDFKLPSSTGLRPFWEEHRLFLEAAGAAEVIAKTIITRDTAIDEVLVAGRMIAARDQRIPFVLQPATGKLAPRISDVMAMQDAALAIIPDVRVIPQVHAMLGVP